MYVAKSVAVRKGPSSDYKKLGTLSKGKKVKVTGKVNDSKWYRIEYNDGVGYVSGSYLQDKPVSDEKEATTSDRKTLMNKEKLHPTRSDYEPAYKLIDKVFAKIHKKGMTTYEKVKACYDYLVDNSSYGKNGVAWDIMFEKGQGFYDYYHDEIRAYGILSTKKGVCDDYSACFAVMLRALGLDCYVVGGQSINSSGEVSGHAWCEVKIDGKAYIFDPQIEDRIVDKRGKNIYNRFFKTYKELEGKYVKQAEHKPATNDTKLCTDEEALKYLKKALKEAGIQCFEDVRDLGKAAQTYQVDGFQYGISLADHKNYANMIAEDITLLGMNGCCIEHVYTEYGYAVYMIYVAKIPD